MAEETEKKKMFVVDDDEIQLLLVEAMLQDEYDIILVRSGHEALDSLLDGFVPDLILLDILMPNMDGWEAFGRMRAIASLQNVPIVFLTSLDATIDKNRGRAMGAADYITKPFTQDELLTRIKIVLDEYQLKKKSRPGEQNCNPDFGVNY